MAAVQYTFTHTNITQNNTNILEEWGPCRIFAGFTLAFALQLSKKHGKTSVRVAEECQLARWRYVYEIYIVYTYSMVQSPSWEANWFAASQEIPRISRNPKVHYRTHKRPPPVFYIVYKI